MKLSTLLTTSALSFSLITAQAASADEIYQQSAVDLCQSLAQKTYTKQCLQKVKSASFNETALAHCAKQKAWNKIKSCLDMIRDKQYEDKPLSLCLSAKYFNTDFKKCMADIADKSYVSDIEINLCQQEKTFPKQMKCLKAATSKPYEDVQKEESENTEQALKELQNKVKKAYELLRQDKTTDATILLHELVTSFEK